MSLYLLINIGSFIIPFLYSFEKRMRFISKWKWVFSAIFITAFFYIGWDVIFTRMGVWGFNPRYHSDLIIFGLPLEEWLFFVCIPYACLFTHYAFRYLFPKLELGAVTTKYFSIFLIVLLSVIAILNVEKAYTFYNYIVLVAAILLVLVFNPKILSSFYLTFFVILLPFFLVNGILTGSFIEDEVVWYNNEENLGIRLFTIPIEDIGYAFSMLLYSLFMIEVFSGKIKKAD